MSNSLISTKRVNDGAHNDSSSQVKRQYVFSGNGVAENWYLTNNFSTNSFRNTVSTVGGDFTANYSIDPSAECLIVVREINSDDEIFPSENVPALVQQLSRTLGEQFYLTFATTRLRDGRTKRFVNDYTSLYNFKNVNYTNGSAGNYLQNLFQFKTGGGTQTQLGDNISNNSPMFIAKGADALSAGSFVWANAIITHPDVIQSPNIEFLTDPDPYLFVANNTLIFPGNTVVTVNKNSQWTFNVQDLQNFNTFQTGPQFVCNVGDYNDYAMNAWSTFGFPYGTSILFFSYLNKYNGLCQPSWWNLLTLPSAFDAYAYIKTVLQTLIDEIKHIFPTDERAKKLTVDYLFSNVYSFCDTFRPVGVYNFGGTTLDYLVFKLPTTTPPLLTTYGICRNVLHPDLTYALRNVFIRSPQISKIFIGRTEDSVLGEFGVDIVKDGQAIRVKYIDTRPDDPQIQGSLPPYTRVVSELELQLTTLNGQPFPFSKNSQIVAYVNFIGKNKSTFHEQSSVRV